MNPGATTCPSASMTRSAAAPLYLPTPTIFPCCTATSAWNAGSPEPSTTRPFLMSRSYAGMRGDPNSRPKLAAEVASQLLHAGTAGAGLGVRVVVRVGVDVVGVDPAVTVSDELDAGDADVVGGEERLIAALQIAVDVVDD